MSTEAIPQAETQAQPRSAAEIGFARRLWWCFRRELWENRSLYLVPLAVSALILFAFALRLIHVPQMTHLNQTLDAGHSPAEVEQPYTMAALVMMAVMMVVGIFYALDALYSERRDRSILFWKSLPVSDTETVLTKASIPIIFLPVLTFAVTVATQALMLVVSAIRTAGSPGLSDWSQLHFWNMSSTLFYHLLLAHGLWYAPIWGWLLLASAWSKRMPALWATLPVIAIGLLERIAFNTSYFLNWLVNRLVGSPGTMPGPKSMTIMEALTPPLRDFLLSPAMWFGLALMTVFLYAAIRLRKVRVPL
jgi:ABC-2 type transport system permease protein